MSPSPLANANSNSQCSRLHQPLCQHPQEESALLQRWHDHPWHIGAVIKENFFKDKHVELKGAALSSPPGTAESMMGSMLEGLGHPAQP